MKTNLTAVDLFAGAGGASEGASQAGVKVLWAANHNPEAVKIHAANHPGASHICQDLHQADWSKVPTADIIMASPACQGHSRARGKDRAAHDVTRSTAWAVVSAAEYHRSPVVVVENVPDFLKWVLFPTWLDAMKRLGYISQVNVLNSADFGVAQSRERLFMTFTKKKPLVLVSPGMKHVPASSIIQWGNGVWKPICVDGRAYRTMNQFVNGRERHGEKFVMAYYGSEKNGRSVNVPLGTVRTKDGFAIVQGDRMRMMNVEEYRLAMGFPKNYILPSNHKLAVHMLGNAVVPAVMKSICEQIKRFL